MLDLPKDRDKKIILKIVIDPLTVILACNSSVPISTGLYHTQID